MKKPLILIFGLLVLLLLPVISAAPPVTTVPQFTTGIAVEYPNMQYLKQNGYYDFHFHLFNLSDGKPIITGATCYFHLYNSTGNHLYKGFDSAVSNEFDYAFMVDGLNFSTTGTYYYITQCNTSTLGGYAEQAFEVTPSGTVYDTPKVLGFIGLLLILVSLIIFIGFKFRDLENYGYLIGMIVIEYMLILFIVYILDFLIPNIFYEAAALVSIVNMALILMLVGIFPLIIFLIFYVLYKGISDKENQKLMGMGYTSSEARKLRK